MRGFLMSATINNVCGFARAILTTFVEMLYKVVLNCVQFTRDKKQKERKTVILIKIKFRSKKVNPQHTRPIQIKPPRPILPVN